MKTIFMTLAAVSALGLAAPAVGQPWSGHRAQSDALQTRIDAGVRSGAISPGEAAPLGDGLRQLVQLERQFAAGGFTGRENAALRQRSALLRRQIGMAERSDRPRGRSAGWQGGDEDERRARWGGRADDRAGSGDRDGDGDRRLSRWEDRSAKPGGGERAGSAGRDDIERYARWDDRGGKDSGVRDGRFDRDNRGDRFAGDVRVGQAATTRMSALPEQYRAEFRDDDRVYYRYDDRRIYQVDRRNGLVLGLLDLSS